MKLKSVQLLLAPIVLALCPLIARADWPARVFAPYMYIGAGDNFKLTDCYQACGLKYYTLAFFIAREDRTSDGGKWSHQYHKEPAWDGTTPLDKNLYADQIDAIRKDGGDVIASFGGADGKEIAFIEDDPVALQADYQAIIDRYKFTWLDFDIEGGSLDMKIPANQRRNSVIANLQKKNPGLRVTFTLPVDPDGISDAAQGLLTDAVAKGVKVYSANIMVMYFGNQFINKGKSEGQLGVESALKAREQVQKIDPDIQIGLCPCLGENGSKSELFTVEDAKVLKDFADKTPWVCSMHYWSINDDTGVHHHRHPTTQPAPKGEPWAFVSIFQPFTTVR